MKDVEVVEAFVAFKAENGYPGLKIDRRPEMESDGEIEAVAGPFAIEHTSIDALPDQRRQNAYLADLIADLEATTVTQQPMQVFLHYDAVHRGQDWPAIRAALKKWLEIDAQRLPDKLTRGAQIPDVPFPIAVLKRADWKAPARIYVGRYVTPNEAALSERIKDLCDRKIAKLSKWANPSTTTVLLLENDDIALMNEFILIDAVIAAYPQSRPASVDEFWYVNSAIQPQLLLHDLTHVWELPAYQRYPEAMWWPPQRA